MSRNVSLADLLASRTVVKEGLLLVDRVWVSGTFLFTRSITALVPLHTQIIVFQEFSRDTRDVRGAGGGSTVSPIVGTAAVLTVLESPITHGINKLLEFFLIKESLNPRPVVPLKVSVFVTVQEPIVDGEDL